MSSTTPICNRDVMNNHYVMVDGMHTVAEAIQEAISNNVNILVVNKRNEHDEYGMVLMSDIARKVLAKDKSPERTNIYEIMIKPVLSLSADMDVRYTARLFERKVIICIYLLCTCGYSSWRIIKSIKVRVFNGRFLSLYNKCIGIASGGINALTFINNPA